MTQGRTKDQHHRTKTVEIDARVKDLLKEGIKKAGTRERLAKVMGYSVPTNIIYQFLSSPRYKKSMSADRLKRLEHFLKSKQ